MFVKQLINTVDGTNDSNNVLISAETLNPFYYSVIRKEAKAT